MATVITNGPIWTGTDTSASWVAIDGTRITAVGDGSPPDGDVIDLEGRSLLPGFQDAHVHPPIGGLAMIRCELHDIDPADYGAAISSYAEHHPDRPWILGDGWPMNAFEGGVPRKEVLDAIVPDRPVFLLSTEGHAAWVNSRALELAGIDANTPDPPHGRIERHPDGTPVGTLQEGAMGLVERIAPADTLDEVMKGITVAEAYLLSLGITGWQDAWVRPIDHTAYRTLDRSGRLIGRAVGALVWDRYRGVEQLDELLAMTLEGTDRYRPTAIKFMVDGVIENGTGAVCSPYVDTDDVGLLFLDADLLNEVVPRVMAAGIQPHFHAIGDRAIKIALDSVAAGTRNDATNVRPHIAHIHLVDPVDVPRFAELGVAANAQALWACNDLTMIDLTIPRLGAERAAWQYPFRAFIDAGAHLAAGSDWSVSTANPFAQMAVAVTRATAAAPEPFLPDQALTRAEALRAFTIGSAWVDHDEQRAGTIEVGKEADLVITSDDPLTVGDLASVRVEATMVRGVTVYER
jgi:hypothetical protein